MEFNFDPVGMISPNSLLGKICLQKFCKNQRGWDKRMPPEELRAFEMWRWKIPLLKQLTVQRWIGFVMLKDKAVLHRMSDASNVGYGAVA